MNDMNEMYKNLGIAVVTQAVMDYHNARFFLDTVNERSFKDETEKKNEIWKALKEIGSVKKFMNGGWFGIICPDVDGPKAFKALSRTYSEEMKFEMAKKYYNLDTEEPELKGYPVSNGYRGWTKNGWMLFETEGAYKEYMTE